VIRKHLGQRQRSEDGWLERDVVLMLNRVALEYFDARIAARESAIGAVTARIEDKDWRRLCLAAQNHRWWVDERDAYRDFGKRLLEAGNFRHSWLRDLRDIVLDAGANPREFDKVSSGIAALTADTDILDCSSVLSMWDEVERQLPQWKLPALYRSLLAASRMRMLGRLGRRGSCPRR
jgi:hypothetical protein